MFESMGRIKGIDYDQEVVAIDTLLRDTGLTAGVLARGRRATGKVEPRWRACVRRH
jgi:hypothetical protein